MFDIELLRENVFKRFGADHAVLFDNSLKSLLLRLSQTQFHIRELQSLQNRVIEGREVKEILQDLFTTHDGSIGNQAIAASANATAALQALHSVSDILGATIMFGMKKDGKWTGYLSQIPSNIRKKIPKIVGLINRLKNNDGYRYLNSAVNYSKHTSVVPTAFVFNFDGSRSHGYDLSYFEKYDEKKDAFEKHRSREALEFLKKEYQRQAEIVQKILILLTKYTAL